MGDVTKNVTEEKIVQALVQQTPLSPVTHELGGGIYYTCHWMKCGNTIHVYQNYCDQCGQRIDWSVK